MIELLILAVALSMDAFAVSIGLGAKHNSRIMHLSLMSAVYFGLFQGVMPLIGYLGGKGVLGWVESYASWIAFLLLLLIGIKMIYESFSESIEEDITQIGDPTPDFTYGINFNANYKKWDFSLAFNGVQGNEIYNVGRYYNILWQDGGKLSDVLNSWTPTNTNTDLPRFIFVDAQKNVSRGANGSSRFWEKGDYLALREVTFSYNVPAEYFNDAFKRLSIYATGSNLHYFKSVSGDTPEVGGVQYGQFPVPRTITIGLNLTF